MQKHIDFYDFSGKKVLVRVDFNVPLNEQQEISDDTRMRAALPTLRKILDRGGSPIVMTHLGRPKGGVDPKFSLKLIVEHLEALLEKPVLFAEDCIGPKAKEAAARLKPGEVLVLENLRFHKEETDGDEGFAKQLAALGDCWVNDAFGTAHRAHASVAIIAKFFPHDKMFGTLVEEELDSLERVVKNPKKPLTAVMGGAKISSKITIIENLLKKVDNLIIGGGMAYTFAKATGGKIGRSLCEDDHLDTARSIIKSAEAQGVQLLLPTDSIVADDFSNDANTKVSLTASIEDGWEGMDVGDQSLERFRKVILSSGTIFWNGPVGAFEMETFAKGSKVVAEAVIEATGKGAFSLVGGGDSIAFLNKFGLADKFSYISTAGGALLEFLEGRELPGIAAVRK